MSTKTQAPQSFCEHRIIHNQIHHFVFRRATHKSIDEFLRMLGDTLDDTSPDAPLLLLLDLRPEGLPPIGYTFPALKKFFARYAYVEREMRVAYLYKSGAIISVLRTLLDVLRLRVTPRFFMDGQEDEALAWLRDG